MKHHSETIHDTLFSHFPISYVEGTGPCPLLQAVRRRGLACKEQLFCGLAVMGIGSIILSAVYLFLSQLAEYGW